MKKLIVTIAILLLFSIVIIVIHIKMSSNKESKNDINVINVNNDSDIKYNYYSCNQPGEFELGYLLAHKNADWERYPLSGEFKNKYNQEDGILGDLQYDSIDYRPYFNSDENYYFKDYNCYFVITIGKLKTAYIYYDRYNFDDGELLDVDILEIINLYDEKGNKLVVYGQKINEDNWISKFQDLAWGHEEEQSVAVTPNFHKKYPLFLDIFEHYSPLIYNHIEFVEEKSSWENKEAYFIVDSKLECKKRYYKVKFTLDDRGYLDDVKVNKVNEEEYEGDKQNISVKLFYNHSNWNEIKITDKYNEKFNGFSYNKDIEKIDIDYETEEEYVDDKNYNEYLRMYKMKDGSTSVYYIKYILDDNSYIDDIECTKLDYDNIPIKEAKELYLKEYSNK